MSKKTSREKIYATNIACFVGVAATLLLLFVHFTALKTQAREPSENKGVAQYEGTISGQWSGSVSVAGHAVDVSGSFSATISADGQVHGTYTGLESGSITGTIDASGEINAKGSAGISEWSGKLNVEKGRLSGSGHWEGFGGGGSWKTD